MKRGLGVAALLMTLPLCACAADEDYLEVRDESGRLHLATQIAYARTADERRDGLRGAVDLPLGEGLLLVFPGRSEVCISNARVAFPIDAIWLRAGVVVHRDSFAADDSRAHCVTDVDAVLEVAAGASATVAAGDEALILRVQGGGLRKNGIR